MRRVKLGILLYIFTTSVYAVLLDPPGSSGRTDELRRKLHATYLEKKDFYTVRTGHVNDAGLPKYTNRLVSEDSPYLLQHAHNPVDWHPWGAAAFALATKENKPVFLSIGYSTCHWCHVMERESFDDESIARLLNENFISIKVDREQRPDLDEIYMTGVQLMTGRGGWPMSNFLTTEGKPFFGGTYFPPRDFVNLLERISEAWQSRRAALLQDADKISAAIARITSASSAAAKIDHLVVTNGVKELIARHDPRHGGFGRSMKFPQESSLLLLLYAWQREADEAARKAALKTLDAMAAGGIYDQVGGGFHRYATDQKWQVPHFEKMLYNQAQLVRVYTKAYEMTGNQSYQRIIEQTLDYVLRDMRAPAGAFYSARDADSEGEEGTFYLWTREQMADVLPPKDARLAQDLFGITQAGNFEGSNIPTLELTLETYATKHELDRDQLIKDVQRIRDKLNAAREKRIHPLRDEKIITAWNGMMITAFVLAAQQLRRDDYLQTAVRAGHEIWNKSWSEQHKLRRIILNDHASITAGLEDYAYLAESYLFLFDATADAVWQSRALLLTEVMISNFWDQEGGGFFLAQAHPDEPSIARPKSPSDGAIASGNSVALGLLVRLWQRTGDLQYRQKINETITAFSGLIQSAPSNHAYMLLGVDDYHEGSVDAVQFSSSGHVKAMARLDESGRFAIDLAISPGWHINAHEINQDDLIATRVEVQGDRWTLDAITYPPGVERRLGFQEAPLNLYEGLTRITGRIKQVDRAPVPLGIHLQACSDEICLPPEWVHFRLFRSDPVDTR